MASTTLILMLYIIHVLSQSPTVGIAGGHSVNIEDVPYMAVLLHVYKYTNSIDVWCGGSIIHKQFVLTSASCSMSHNSYSTLARVGSSLYNEGGELHHVEKYIRHESFSSKTFYNNVGLLKLTEPVTFGPSVAVIKLADDSVSITVGLTANVNGWGFTMDSLGDSRELQQVSVTVSTPDECDYTYNRNSKKFTDKQICVTNEDKGSCFSDAGGPITAENVQIGIVSYGEVCWGLPNVYEKVAPHLQWIRNKIKQNL